MASIAARQVFAIALFLLATRPAVVMGVRFVKERNQEATRRNLFADKIGRGTRGGAAGAAKGLGEYVPMRARVGTTVPSAAPVPTVAPVPTASPTNFTNQLTGCSFMEDDGSVVTFDEGESMGSYSTLAGCDNGNPDDFPCLCAADEPGQTFCPYCVFRDAFDDNLCQQDGSLVQFISSETNALTECSCSIMVEQVGDRFDVTFQYTIDSTCEEVTPEPTTTPTTSPTSESTTASPTTAPVTDAPTGPPTDPTFVMGRLNKVENDLTLSEGLNSRIIAKAFEPLTYATGVNSTINFHRRPSGGDTFEDTRRNSAGGFRNPGGWVYVSSSDAPSGNGGVGALTFDRNGELVNYQMVLDGTSANSNGGRTPWGSWVSGERDLASLGGKIYQVDPMGVREASSNIAWTGDGGAWEGFTYRWDSPQDIPTFYMSEDFVFGAIRRFTPSEINTVDPWLMLEDVEGDLSFLVLQPDTDASSGTFTWTSEIQIARGNAAQNYPEAQGIDVEDNILSFVCRGIRQLYQLDLDEGTYNRTSTTQGLMEGEPNEIRYATANNGETTLLYMTEADGRRSGIHARDDEDGIIYTVLEGFLQPLTAGFALSPNGKHMYVSFKRDGTVFEITRDDGLSFFDTITFEATDAVSAMRVILGH
ncbi:osmC-like protein [Seminavis robusta]|uniref:OsmC-like protein n=1 Tax=Seminavis robusta TaxID=568900 RepID=A0A9N8DQ88_9STRA|nr:osmC-like protein [Seminavis robusta]|eukprot:Sro207_g086740.1 osmC-like protein (646) ;mRNA; f:6801-8830